MSKAFFIQTLIAFSIKASLTKAVHNGFIRCRQMTECMPCNIKAEKRNNLLDCFFFEFNGNDVADSRKLGYSELVESNKISGIVCHLKFSLFVFIRGFNVWTDIL